MIPTGWEYRNPSAAAAVARDCEAASLVTPGDDLDVALRVAEKHYERADTWRLIAWVWIALAVVLTCALCYEVASAQPGVLGPQGRYYYYRGSEPVRVLDGGTESRTVEEARRRLNVPCRHCADSLAANWKMTGSLILPFTYWRDTLGVFTDDADTTKKGKFQLSGIGAGMTRWLTWPNRSGVIATENGAALTGATFLDGSIDRSSIRVRDDQFWIKDNADTTKRWQFAINPTQTTGTTNTWSITNTGDPATGATGTLPVLEMDNNFSGQYQSMEGTLVIGANGGPGNYIQLYDQDGTGGTPPYLSRLGGVAGYAVLIHFDGTASRQQAFPDLSGTLLVNASAQPVGDKTLYTTNTLNVRDDRFSIKDNSDTTKIATFEASGITTGTTRTFTLPNVSSTVAVVGTNNNFTVGQQITASSAGNVPLTLKLAASQTASGFEIRNSGNSVIAGFEADGDFTGQAANFSKTVNATDSLTVASSGSDPYVSINTFGGSLQVIQSHAGSGSNVYTLPRVSGRFVVNRDSLNRGGQVASIATANLSTSPPAGLYQIDYTLANTTAAAAGTVTVTFGWTDEVGATTFTSSALLLSATGRLTDNHPKVIYVASGNVTYATTVAGLTGTPAYTVRARLVPLE